MARKLRVFLQETPQHIILKTINEMEVFNQIEDSEVFLNFVYELQKKYQLKIHSYILGKTFFQFLATPATIDSLPKFMQSLGRLYVTYYNKKNNRSGTLWQGRYKSSVVEADNYFFDLMCFIEKETKNIVRSSLDKNLYNKKDIIVTYHDKYKKLGYTQEERVLKYKEIFFKYDTNKNDFIANCLDKQIVTGSVKYIQNLELKLGIALGNKQRGRPKKKKKQKETKMYKNLQVLDKEKHKDLKISPLEDLNFAKQSPFIPLVANEVSNVGAAFPVVFTSDENSSLVSIVSLGGDSLAINNDGKWITNYVPSFLRKYPFSLASTKENSDQKVILIDEDSTLFSKSKGKQLFKKSGEQSEVLENAVKFLTSHEEQNIITTNIINEIVKSGILDDREISVGEGEEKKILVNGFKVVDKEKLNKLSDDILASWARRGIISFIDAHIKSLNNIQTLFNLASQRQQ